MTEGIHNSGQRGFLRKRPWLWGLAIGLLILPALVVNLDKQPFINDEAIRSVVALEMIYSGDYITPTLAGALYFKKPPVYNWLIVLFFRVTGDYSEFTLRSVAVFSLLVYVLLIYLFIRPGYGSKTAILSALMFLTSGRILFYDSFHGLIDIGFSAVVYLSLMSVYQFYRRENLWMLFLVSYFLTGVAFLMKGLPALYFQGASLLAWFVYKKDFRRLISWQHLAGILVLLMVTGSYYLAYLHRNPGTLAQVIDTLLIESTQKSALGVSILRTIRHLFTFPFEFIFHFVPWTLMGVYLLRKQTWKQIRQDEFMAFSLLLFAVNILIFWFSAGTYARYLFLHVSLLFPVLLSIHQRNQQEQSIHYRVTEMLFLATGILLAGAALAFAFVPLTNFVDHPFLKAILCSSGILFFVLLFRKNRRMQLFSMVAFLLVFRISMNLFALPSREKEAYITVCRDRALETAEKYPPGSLSFIRPAESKRLPIHTIYYLSREWKQIIPSADKPLAAGRYVVYEPEFKGYDYIKLEDLPTTEMDKVFSIIEIRD